MIAMADVFVSRVRPFGTSLGLIIPRQVVSSEDLKPGKEVRVSIMQPSFALLDKLLGSMKGARPFRRSRRDRI